MNVKEKIEKVKERFKSIKIIESNITSCVQNIEFECKLCNNTTRTTISYLFNLKSSNPCIFCGDSRTPITKEAFLYRANKRFNHQYDYSLSVYINKRKKIKIICPKHGCFEQPPIEHLKNEGCPKCTKLKINIKQRISKEDFIKRAKRIHKKYYSYGNMRYIDLETKILITCPNHGDFSQRPSNHLSGNGCPSCGNMNRKKTLSYSWDFFVEKSNIIHNNKYYYINNLYINMSSKIKIICPRHGTFEQIGASHLNGHGCPKCGNEEVSKKNKLLPEDFFKRCENIHNNKYKYIKRYEGIKKDIEYYCSKHGKIKQKALNHLIGFGCPLCKNSISKGEKEIQKLLLKNKISFETQKTFENCCTKKSFKLFFDFFLPEKNILIEYQGEQHYTPIKFFGGENKLRKQQNNDKIKREFCKKERIRLLEIPYTEFNNIKSILIKEEII